MAEPFRRFPGYTRFDINFSVEYRNGQWIRREKQPSDQQAFTMEHVNAIEDQLARDYAQA